MKEQKRHFLAQVALGWFTIKEDGTIWRNVVFHGGGVPTMKWIHPVRAERSVSSRKGYRRIMFYAEGKRMKVGAHRIVWMHHNHLDMPETLEINHKDEVKSHNHPDNLELNTRSENVKYSLSRHPRNFKSLNILGGKGEGNHASKLTDMQVKEIRRLYKLRTMCQREIAQRYAITQAAVSRIILRKSWGYLE
jgi:hypothetical protein